MDDQAISIAQALQIGGRHLFSFQALQIGGRHLFSFLTFSAFFFSKLLNRPRFTLPQGNEASFMLIGPF
jgi:hypothetical protein